MTLNLPADKNFLTEKELATLLRVALSSVRNLRRSGQIAYLRIGTGHRGRVVYAREDVQAFIERARELPKVA